MKPSEGKFFVLIALLMIAGFANASILASTSTDKKTLGENEVALLTVKLMNDSTLDAQGINLRVQADEGIIFIDGMEERPNFIKTIDTIKSGELKEITIKIKATSAAKESANIYAYYGTGIELMQAAVAKISLEPAAAEIKSSYQKESTTANDSIIVDFSLKNNSKNSLYQASAEAIAPKDFEINTPPVLEEKILPGGVMAQKFKIAEPPNASGEQTIIIAYGYFDSNVPHYFEKNITYNTQKLNYPLLALIGFAVLVVAAYLFFRKGEKSGVKGTKEKEEWAKSGKGK